MANVNRQLLSINMDTVNAGEKGFRAPFDGKILSVAAAVNVAIGTATETITAEIDGTAVTGVSLPITTARAVGYCEVDFPTGALSFRKGQYVSAVNDGASSAGNVTITFDLQQD